MHSDEVSVSSAPQLAGVLSAKAGVKTMSVLSPLFSGFLRASFVEQVSRRALATEPSQSEEARFSILSSGS